MTYRRPPFVMAGLGPAIHVLADASNEDVDGRPTPAMTMGGVCERPIVKIMSSCLRAFVVNSYTPPVTSMVRPVTKSASPEARKQITFA